MVARNEKNSSVKKCQRPATLHPPCPCSTARCQHHHARGAQPGVPIARRYCAGWGGDTPACAEFDPRPSAQIRGKEAFVREVRGIWASGV